MGYMIMLDCLDVTTNCKSWSLRLFCFLIFCSTFWHVNHDYENYDHDHDHDDDNGQDKHNDNNDNNDDDDDDGDDDDKYDKYDDYDDDDDDDNDDEDDYRYGDGEVLPENHKALCFIIMFPYTHKTVYFICVPYIPILHPYYSLVIYPLVI